MKKGGTRRPNLVGDLEAPEPGGPVRGWCWSPQEPGRRRVVALVIGERVLAQVVCDQVSERLIPLGVGDGAHAFSWQPPRAVLPAGAGVVEIGMIDEATGRAVGKAVAYRHEAEAAPALRFVLERAQEDGLLSGWCWSPEEPERRVALNVLVDGAVVGMTVADVFRADLLAGGVGDGAHGFSFLLPWEVVSAHSAAQIGLADASTGRVLPVSTVFRRLALLPVEERMRDVERQVRLLSSRLQGAEREAREQARLLRGVLGTIGAFFTRLAELPPEDAGAALVPGLAALVAQDAGERPVLRLAVCAAPVLTVCVEAGATLGETLDCLRALHEAGVDERAELVLIDAGRSDVTALVGACVQNLRVWRVQPGQSVPEARNSAVLPAGRAFAGFVASRTRVGAGWLDAALAVFERHPRCAMVGAKLVHADGTVAASGLLPGRDGGLEDFAAGEHAHKPEVDRLRAVAAVGDGAVVVRGAAFARAGGFEMAIADGGMAAVALSLRFWEGGEQVFYQPAGAVRWEGGAPRGADAAAIGDLQWMSHRWAGMAAAAWPVVVGRVLLIGLDEEGSVALLAGFGALGFEGHYASAAGLGDGGGLAEVLRSAGVTVMRAPFQTSVAAGVRDAVPGFDLVVFTAGAAGVVPPGSIGAVSAARLVLLLGPEVEAVGGVLAAAEACGCVLALSAAVGAAVRAALPGVAVAGLEAGGDVAGRLRRALGLFGVVGGVA